MNTASITQITDADRFASIYYGSLVTGQVRKGEPFPGDQLRGWAPLFKQAYDVYHIDLEFLSDDMSEELTFECYSRAAKTAQSSFDGLRRQHPKLDELIRAIDASVDEDVAGSGVLAPALRASATFDYTQGAAYRKWLDVWVNYALEVYPAAERIHIESVGLWMLSTLIARRLAIVKVLHSPLHPILYLALASRSSVGKSMLVELALSVLEEIGLKEKLTFEGDLSPQLLTRIASGKVNDTYATMTEEEREEERISMIFAGCKGWYFDELGKRLQQLNSPSGGNQAQKLVELLLTWYSGKGQSRGSLTHGMDRVREVFMPLLGCMTITNMQQMQRLGTSFWNDGFLARLCIATAPVRKWEDIELRRGRPDFPKELTEPLLRLHTWLGEPDTRIVETPSPKGSVYRLERNMPAPHYRSLDQETFKAYERYFNATGSLHLTEDVPEEISTSYRRLPIMAVCVAALLAAVDNGGEITLGHWIAAQGVAESWRESLHEFHKQVFVPEESVSRRTEDRVIKAITASSRKKAWLSEPAIRRQTGLSNREIGHIISDALGKVIVACYVEHPKHPNQPTKKYALIGTPLPVNGNLADL